MLDLNAIFRRFGSGGVVRSFSVNEVDWTRTSGRVDVELDDVDDDVVATVLDVVGPADVDVVLDVELEVDDDELVELVVPGALVDVDGDVVLLVLVELVVASEVLDEVDVLLDVLDVVLWDVELDELVLLLDDDELLVDVDELVVVLVEEDVLLLEVVVVGIVEDEVVVVGEPHAPVCGDTLAGFAGSVPQSSSRRSYVPSRSRSTPMRVPEPRGTQV